MQTDIRPFLFEGEYLVRTIDRDGDPWFVAPDACRTLGIKNVTDAVSRLDDDEKGLAEIETLGGLQRLNVVSEPGLYKLVSRSNKPVAKRFDRWVRHDVLPAIRKTGSYSVHVEQIIPPPIMERRPFPDWPLEEMRTKRGVVDMYRHLYGPMAAQWITPQLGFPNPPLELVERGRQYSMTLVFPEGVSA